LKIKKDGSISVSRIRQRGCRDLPKEEDTKVAVGEAERMREGVSFSVRMDLSPSSSKADRSPLFFFQRKHSRNDSEKVDTRVLESLKKRRVEGRGRKVSIERVERKKEERRRER